MNQFSLKLNGFPGDYRLIPLVLLVFYYYCLIQCHLLPVLGVQADFDSKNPASLASSFG